MPFRGTDARHIATVDADGVALAAIQGLNQLVTERSAQLIGRDEQIESLEAQNAALTARLSALEKSAASLLE